jgi:hypothetical protein
VERAGSPQVGFHRVVGLQGQAKAETLHGALALTNEIDSCLTLTMDVSLRHLLQVD